MLFMIRLTAMVSLIFLATQTIAIGATTEKPATDDGHYFVLPASEVPSDAHSAQVAATFSKYTNGYNRAVLRAVDKVQSSAPDGGGYFIGVHAKPAESPIGYELKLFGTPLLTPPRTTSYCSGSSYTAFIEALNLIFADKGSRLSRDREEALRMQEPDGSRREDGVKFWGHWNDDGPGTQYALVQYAKMGEAIAPNHARPGDFANISWTSGLGHSVVFLAFFQSASGEKRILYWSSQPGTHGLGIQSSPLSKVKSINVIRLTHPERVFTFDPSTPVQRKIPSDVVRW